MASIGIWGRPGRELIGAALVSGLLLVLFSQQRALLPAAGFPISVFNLTAASAFAAQMGLVGVIVAAGAAIAVNLALTYWLARYALRPWLEQMISRTKYKIPVVAAADQVPAGDAGEIARFQFALAVLDVVAAQVDEEFPEIGVSQVDQGLDDHFNGLAHKSTLPVFRRGPSGRAYLRRDESAC